MNLSQTTTKTTKTTNSSMSQQSPRRSIRNVTAALQSNSTAAAAAASSSSATPRALIRDLLAAPPTVAATARRRGRTSRVVDESAVAATTTMSSTTAAVETLTPRNLIRNVAAFDTPFTSRATHTSLSSFASTATAAQLPPPPPPLFMQQTGAAAFSQQHAVFHAGGGDIDDDARDDVLVSAGPRVRRSASAADRAHVRDLQAQLAAIGHQFVDPGAPVATLPLFPPASGAAAARRVGKRVMTREHIEAIQRGRARSLEKRKQQQSVIGGAHARRQTDDNNNNNNDDDDADGLDRARGKKRRVSSMMPGSWVKDLFLAHTAPGTALSADVLKTVLKLSDQYWARAVDDLCAYADTKPRGGAVVSADDVELLFSRQRLTGNSRSVDDLAREFLPADLRREVVPIARANNVVEPALAHRQKKKKTKAAAAGKKSKARGADEIVP